jgi:hypothetical protein
MLRIEAKISRCGYRSRVAPLRILCWFNLRLLGWERVRVVRPEAVVVYLEWDIGLAAGVVVELRSVMKFVAMLLFSSRDWTCIAGR